MIITSALTGFLRRRWLAILIMVISIGLIFGIGALIPSELAPMEDKSRLSIMSHRTGRNLL